MDRLFDPESGTFRRVQDEFAATPMHHLEQVLQALRTLRSQAPAVPQAFYGVCGNVRDIVGAYPDSTWEASEVDVNAILEYIGWHWPDAIRLDDEGTPASYFCCAPGVSDSYLYAELWAGAELERRLQFIEFAIDFLKEKINVAI